MQIKLFFFNTKINFHKKNCFFDFLGETVFLFERCCCARNYLFFKCQKPNLINWFVLFFGLTCHLGKCLVNIMKRLNLKSQFVISFVKVFVCNFYTKHKLIQTVFLQKFKWVKVCRVCNYFT